MSLTHGHIYHNNTNRVRLFNTTSFRKIINNGAESSDVTYLHFIFQISFYLKYNLNITINLGVIFLRLFFFLKKVILLNVTKKQYSFRPNLIIMILFFIKLNMYVLKLNTPFYLYSPNNYFITQNHIIFPTCLLYT